MTPDEAGGPQPRAALLVANDDAGSADEEALQAALDALADREVEVARTGSVDDLDAALERLGDRVLIVAGGDGSLHLAIERLHLRGALADVVVGLVPLGTGNDFARGVDVPLDAAEAARALASARPARCDLIVADDGSVVVNAVHAGLGAAAAERSEGLKDRLGPLAYPLGALIAGVREGGYDETVTVDGEVVHAGPALMIGVGNATHIGGGTLLCPDAVPDDGLLDVVVATGVGPAARVAFGVALHKGVHVDRDDVVVATGREVRIHGEPLPHDADGELTEPLADRTYRIEPAAWRLLRP